MLDVAGSVSRPHCWQLYCQFLCRKVGNSLIWFSKVTPLCVPRATKTEICFNQLCALRDTHWLIKIFRMWENRSEMWHHAIFFFKADFQKSSLTARISNKKGNVRINETLRRVRLIIFCRGKTISITLFTCVCARARACARVRARACVCVRVCARGLDGVGSG